MDNFEWCVHKKQTTNLCHSAFKEPSPTTSTSCEWPVLTVHIKGSEMDLGQAVKFGHNDKKDGSQVRLGSLCSYQRENNLIVHDCDTTITDLCCSV